MSRGTRSIVLSLTSVLLCACSSTEMINVKVMRPAAVNLGQYNSVAVDQFTGHGGSHISGDLSTALSNVKNPMTGELYVNVLDHRDVDKALEDLKRKRGRQWDERTMSLLNEWKNAEVVIKGQVPAYEVVENLRESEWVDLEGYPHKTYTRDSTANVTVIIEATRIDKSKVFDTVKYNEVVSDTSTAVDAMPPTVDPNQLLSEARRRIVRRYCKRVAPYEEHIRVRLYKESTFPELKIGNGLARTGAWDAALMSYRKALDHMTGELAQYRYMALLNIGVAFKYTNQFEEARQALKEAYAYDQSDLILEELESVNFREREYMKLVEQGEKSATAS